MLVSTKRRQAKSAQRRSRDGEHGRDVPMSPRGSTEGSVRHRAGPPPEDKALYTCSCGFVFDAPVTTSVQCVHCGQTQAW